jgi:hypothetical protein
VTSAQAGGAVALSVVVRSGPVMTAAKGTLEARPGRKATWARARGPQTRVDSGDTPDRFGPEEPGTESLTAGSAKGWSLFTRRARPASRHWPTGITLLGGPPMSLDDNKAIIRSYVETVWNRRLS